MATTAADVVLDDNRVFAEAHFYDGGLRHLDISKSHKRPLWAPDPAWVGFRDEVRMQPDDTVVELVKFRNGPNIVSWLAVYSLAPDAKYGNRNNHAGVGLWLRDLFPRDPENLIDGLLKLLSQLKTKPQDQFVNATRSFLTSFVGEVVSPYTQLAAPLDGLPPSSSQSFGTIGYNVPRDERFAHRLNGAIYRAYFLHPATENASRMLLHLHGRDKVGEFSSTLPDEFDGELVQQLPVAFSQQTTQLDNASKELAKLERERDDLDAKIDALHLEKAALTNELEAARRDHHQLKQSIEDNDELKRFAALSEGITHVRQLTIDLQRRLPDLERNIVTEIRTSAKQSFIANQSTFGSGSGHPARSPSTTRTPTYEPGPDWRGIIMIGLISLIVALFGIGIYFSLLWLELIS